jgi:hypothetical protein
MKHRSLLLAGAAAWLTAAGPGAPAWAATTVQIGSSGKTFASSAVQCATGPGTSTLKPMVQAGLFNPKPNASADVTLNGGFIAKVTAVDAVATVWLGDGNNAVAVVLSKKATDQYVFSVAPGLCSLPDTSGNTFSADGTLEFAASGKSYATVTPGCAISPTSGQPQPYVNLFDNGVYLLNVSVNGVPLTQLSAQHAYTPVFLRAGPNVISAANGSLSTDHFIRDGGNGSCALTP